LPIRKDEKDFTGMLIWELSLVGSLILLNGFFAMSELAIVSARRARLQHMAQTGTHGARRALRLAEDPTSFLSTVQVGITLVGIFAGAYGSATLAEPLAALLRTLPAMRDYADAPALGIVIVAITYLSLIVGELVPKRMALNNAEGIAAFVAEPMHLLARAGRPVVWFLGVSTNAVLALLRIRPNADSTVSEEEVRLMIAEGTDAGVFEPAEREMIESVLAMADRTVRAIMVPRPEVVWLDVNDTVDAIFAKIRDSDHSRFPVSHGDLDDDLGIVHAKDLLEQLRDRGVIDLHSASREPLYVPETMPILKLIDRFKASALHMAIVIDEHGSFEGAGDTDGRAHRHRRRPSGGPGRRGVRGGSARRRLLAARRQAAHRPGRADPRDSRHARGRGLRLPGRLRALPLRPRARRRRALHLARLALRGRRLGRPAIDKVLASLDGE
jgi:putative hemolysin